MKIKQGLKIMAIVPKHGQCLDGSASPETEMIIIYDLDSPNGSSEPQDGSADRTGIVCKVEKGIVYTVEGNSGDNCRIGTRQVGTMRFLGTGFLSIVVIPF